MTTSVSVCIPWRATPDRRRAFDRVIRFWGAFGYAQDVGNLHLGDSTKSKPFNLSRARNMAARNATGEVIIMADADTIPDIGAVQKAVEIAAQGGVVVYPFDTYRHIPGDAVGLSDLLTIAPDREYYNSVGGVFVVARDTFFALGGQDERFEPRWGYEDSAFHLVACTMARVARVPGKVYSFNHSADRDLSDDNPNKHRYALYRYANGSQTVMRELIKP